MIVLLLYLRRLNNKEDLETYLFDNRIYNSI